MGTKDFPSRYLKYTYLHIALFLNKSENGSNFAVRPLNSKIRILVFEGLKWWECFMNIQKKNNSQWSFQKVNYPFENLTEKMKIKMKIYWSVTVRVSIIQDWYISKNVHVAF